MSSQKKIGLFLLLTAAFSLIGYVPLIAIGTEDNLASLFVLILMLAPGLAGVLTQFVATRSLRGMGWHPGRARWLGVAYFLPIVYALPVYAFAWLAGLGVFPNPDRIARLAERYSSSNVATTVTIFVLLSVSIGMLENLISGLFEEVGWRGLLVPELAKVTSFTKTALISGVVWAAWHMPGIFLVGLSGDTPAGYAAVWFAVMIIALSFPMAWLTLKSGSLWPAALLHASHNLFVQGIFDQLTGKTEITPYITGEYGIGLALTLLVVAYIVWRSQRDVSLRTQPLQAQPVVQPESSSAL